MQPPISPLITGENFTAQTQKLKMIKELGIIIEQHILVFDSFTIFNIKYMFYFE